MSCPKCDGIGLEITSLTAPNSKVPLVYVSDCPKCDGTGETKAEREHKTEFYGKLFGI